MEGSHHHGAEVCCGLGHGWRRHEEECGQASVHLSHKCCCGGHVEDAGRLQRRHRSREERLARLEEYRKDLQEELKGVEERIAEVSSGM